MDRFEQLINVSLLKSLINSQIDESDDIRLMNAKLKQLERDRLNDSVEIYGIHDARLASKRVRTRALASGRASRVSSALKTTALVLTLTGPSKYLWPRRPSKSCC